ncbi:MAG: MFS transporter [Bacteroidetes bacterium]|nr:MFS transporter [Bacteroidota bacterium]
MTGTTARQSWYALFVLFLINALNFYDRQIIGAVAEPIRKEWSLSDMQLGVLSTAFILMYAVVGLPFGRLSDRYSRKHILSIGVILWSLLTALSGIAGNYAGLFASRLGVGFGEASCAPAANSLIGDLFPARRRATALAIFMLGLPVGLFLSYRISGIIAQAYSWREAFYFASIPGLLIGMLALFIVEPERGATEIHAVASRRRPGFPFFVVLGIPTVLWIIISGALHNFNMYTFGAFLPAFLMRVHKLPLKEANTISSIVTSMGIIGLLGGGWVGDYLGKKLKNGKLLLAAVAMLLSGPCIYFSITMEPGNTTMFVTLLGLGTVMIYAYYSCVYATIHDVVEPALRGTAMALYFFAMYLLGGSIGPVITGYLSDHYAKQAMQAAGAIEMTEAFKAEGLQSAIMVIPAVCLALAVVLFAGSTTVKKDHEKLEHWMQSKQDSPTK